VRGEFDLSDQLLAYAAFGASETHYRYSGAMSATVINNAGDLSTTMGQLKMDIEKTSGEAGLRWQLQTGPVAHQWVVNATRYADKQKDYGRRSVPGANWVTNIYHPTWGPQAAQSFPAVAG
jgi:iron complex outermembrane receptor protein